MRNRSAYYAVKGGYADLSFSFSIRITLAGIDDYLGLGNGRKAFLYT